jgi:hypothetical protein
MYQSCQGSYHSSKHTWPTERGHKMVGGLGWPNAFQIIPSSKLAFYCT